MELSYVLETLILLLCFFYSLMIGCITKVTIQYQKLMSIFSIEDIVIKNNLKYF